MSYGIAAGGGLTDYVLGTVVSRGLAGPRYAGRYRKTGHTLALEELTGAYLNRPEFVGVLATAAEKATLLRDHHSVEVYDLVRAEGRLYLVTELLSGRMLATLLEHQEKLEPASALYVATCVLESLEAAHELGIVHGDISPQCITIARDGTVRVDGYAMGYALACDSKSPEHPYLWREGRDRKAPQSEDDVYAAAALLHLMLTGSLPGSDPEHCGYAKIDTLLRKILPPNATGMSAREFRKQLDAAAEEEFGTEWRADANLMQPLVQSRVTQSVTVSSEASELFEREDAPEPAPKEKKSRTRAKRAAHESSHRKFWALVVLIIVAGAGAAGAGTYWYVNNQAAKTPLTLENDTKLTVSPATGGCDTVFTATAAGDVDGTGTLVYRWEQSNGQHSADLSVPINSGIGAFNFTWSWDISGPESKPAVTFHILQPVDRKLTQQIAYRCG